MKILKVSAVVCLLLAAAMGQVSPQQRQQVMPAFTPFLQPSAPALAGLWVNVSTGQVYIPGATVVIAPVRIPMVPNTTNYIYIDMAVAQIKSNTTGFIGSIYPIATAATNSKMILSLIDQRPDVFGGGGSGGGTITTVAGLASIPGLVVGTTATVTDGQSTSDCTAGGGSNLVQCVWSGSTWGPFGSSSGGGTVTNIITGSGLTGGPITSSGTLSIATGGVTNAMLANPSTTVNSQTCTLGTLCNIPFQTNNVNNSSLAGLNFLTSTTNAAGLTVTPTNSGSNQLKFEVTGGSYSGNAATASNLSGSPTLPNGTSAVTQSPGDSTTKIASDAFVLANSLQSATASGGLLVSGTSIGMLTSCSSNQVLRWTGSAWACASVGTITGATSGGGLTGSTTLGLLTSCSSGQVLAWGGSSWACTTVTGTGTVTNVTGTANQISVATGTTTPVLSLPTSLAIPGDMTIPAANSLGFVGQSLFLAADSTISTLDVGSTAGGTDGLIKAAGLTATGVLGGNVIMNNGNGSCPSPALGSAIICNSGSLGEAFLSENGGSYSHIASGGNIPFDSSSGGLAAPTTSGLFTYPATSGLTLQGTAPGSTSSNGTNAGSLFTLNTPTGGATTGSATTAGNGGGVTWNFGNGGSGSGGTNAQGGQGGGAHFLTGNGGPSSGTAANSPAGDFEVTVGTAGTGGSGAAGRRGRIFFDQTVSNAITNSPRAIWRATYESAATPTFGNDDWGIEVIEQASTVNGNTTLNISQTGSTGTATVAMPTLTLGTNTAGVLAGTMTVNNATSGSILVTPPTGALGSVTLTWPIANGTIAETTGTLTTGHCGQFDSTGRIVDSGSGCGGTGSGTVASGTATQLAVYTGSTTVGSTADWTYVTHTLAGGASAILDLSAMPVGTGFKIPAAAGAAPTTENLHAFNTTNHTNVWGSNGTTVVGAVAATGTNTATTCSNQYVTAVSGIAAPTCSTITLASASFANQGTTTTVLHGNGSGNPSFGSIVAADITSATITGTQIASSIALAGSPTTTTQSAGDNSTKVATTAYVDVNTCEPGSFASQTDGATVTWAVASAKCANASLTFTVHSGSRTLNLTGLVTGGSYVIKLIQDGTGGENLTGGTGCTWKQAGGGGSTFTLTATASAIDVLAFMYDGTNCLATLTKAFS